MRRPGPRFLTAAELCDRSGLPPNALLALEDAKLLLPDQPGLYRRKQVLWAGKLVWLLTDGWTVAEIKAWTRVRWTLRNPKIWPPSRSDISSLANNPKEG